MASFFHVFFKAAALVVYLFSGWFIGNFVLTFVILILLLAFDFWTVKNVTGRLLVGLRWWNDVKDDGTNLWIFESHPLASQMPAADKRLFWTALYATPLAWLGLMIIAFVRFNFDWMIVCVVAMGLSVANVVGYTKCSSDAKSKAQMAQGMMAMVQPTGLSLLTTAWKMMRGAGDNKEQNPQPVASIV